MKDIKNLTYYLKKDKQALDGNLRLDAINSFLGHAFHTLLQCELDIHLGYNKNSSIEKNTLNRRNGYTKKKIKGSFGEIELKIPRDRDGSFNPFIIKKRNKEIDAILEMIFGLFSIKLKEKDGLTFLSDLYKDEFSTDQISDIYRSFNLYCKKNKIFWDLDEQYENLFIDKVYFSALNKKNKKKRIPLLVLTGVKDNKSRILGIYLVKTNSQNRFLKIFNNLKERGLLSVDNVVLESNLIIESALSYVYEDTKIVYPIKEDSI